MRSLAFVGVSLTVLLWAASSSQGSLIGDTVSMSHRYPTMDIGDIYDGPYNVVVAVGTSDRTGLTASVNMADDYGVHVEANVVKIDFVDTLGFTAGTSFHGVVIDSLDWVGDPGWEITGVEVSTSMSGFSDSRVTFGPHWVAVNWQGLTVSSGTTFDITLLPEPSTVAVLSLGAMALVRRRRGRR